MAASLKGIKVPMPPHINELLEDHCSRFDDGIFIGPLSLVNHRCYLHEGERKFKNQFHEIVYKNRIISFACKSNIPGEELCVSYGGQWGYLYKITPDVKCLNDACKHDIYPAIPMTIAKRAKIVNATASYILHPDDDGYGDNDDDEDEEWLP